VTRPNHNISTASGASPKKGRRRIRLFVAALNLVYLLTVLAVWALLKFGAESWWLATLVLFGPRWVVALPLLVLAPITILIHRRTLWITCISAAVVLFPVMDLCIPWRVPFVDKSGFHLRVLTCNIHRHLLSAAAMSELIDQTQPDVVVLEEWTSQDQRPLFSQGAWYMRREGEFFMASRFPVRDARRIFEGKWAAGEAVDYKLALPGRTIDFVAVHLASPHNQFQEILEASPDAPDAVQDNSRMRAEQSASLANFASQLGNATILAGDFNTPGNSPLFESAWSIFTDAFAAAGLGIGNTYHYRWSGTRIDHILLAAGWNCSDCQVGPPVGSPHRPLVADLNWGGTRWP
jgi:vancomycin resistance protein VanJ